jgi:hypothetical protein
MIACGARGTELRAAGVSVPRLIVIGFDPHSRKLHALLIVEPSQAKWVALDSDRRAVAVGEPISAGHARQDVIGDREVRLNVRTANARRDRRNTEPAAAGPA